LQQQLDRQRLVALSHLMRLVDGLLLVADAGVICPGQLLVVEEEEALEAASLLEAVAPQVAAVPFQAARVLPVEERHTRATHAAVQPT
jgi:hypothetical protein